jgi:hypothetical protein
MTKHQARLNALATDQKRIFNFKESKASRVFIGGVSTLVAIILF